MNERIILGSWTEDELERLMKEAAKVNEPGSRIASISKQFLNTDYNESTLTGDINTTEVFVINIEGVDCFTFIDYVEAMRLSASFSEFKENLKKVRYRSGDVAFENRNHFFTDWREFNSELVHDVTAQISGQKIKSITKIPNKKKDSSCFLEGVQPVQREIKFIPSDTIEDLVIKALRTGDYAGMYSDSEGLDVTHVGIIIKKGNSVYLRHASSAKQHRKVIDQDFKDYISDKPGLIVLRPR